MPLSVSLADTFKKKKDELSTPKQKDWKTELGSIYDQISARQGYTYDQNSDPLAKQYQEMYAKNAKLAMEDTVGQVSALSGGYANSYAQTAGQAMYNQQMGQMNDKALQLAELGRQNYDAETQRLMNMYSVASNQYAQEYAEKRDKIEDAKWAAGTVMSGLEYAGDLAYKYASLGQDASQFGASLAFDAERAAASDAQWEKQFAYQQLRDGVSDEQYASDLAYKYANLYKNTGGGGGSGASSGSSASGGSSSGSSGSASVSGSGTKKSTGSGTSGKKNTGGTSGSSGSSGSAAVKNYKESNISKDRRDELSKWNLPLREEQSYVSRLAELQAAGTIRNDDELIYLLKKRFNDEQIAEMF